MPEPLEGLKRLVGGATAARPDLCLQLSQELGVTVQHQKPRGKSASDRVSDATQLLAEEGLLRGAFRVPDAVGPVAVEANLSAGRVTTSVELDAPKDVKRPSARINWILRQLREAPDDLRVDVLFAQRRGTESELLRDCRDNPARLLLEDDPKREPRAFVLALSRAMGKKRGRTEGSFVSETRRQAMDSFRGNFPYVDFPEAQEVVRDACGRREDDGFGPAAGRARRRGRRSTSYSDTRG